MTDQQQSREHEQWIVVAEWADGSPTHYGPFDSIVEANRWAYQFLAADAESWEPALLSNVAPSQLSEHTQRAIQRILDAAATR
jgi:hypothetical protein